ncbi:hypothetical protein QYM36_010205, partial [Artemia franciscana]
MLTLSPGIADVERGFSRSGRILGEDQVKSLNPLEPQSSFIVLAKYLLEGKLVAEICLWFRSHLYALLELTLEKGVVQSTEEHSVKLYYLLGELCNEDLVVKKFALSYFETHPPPCASEEPPPAKKMKSKMDRDLMVTRSTYKLLICDKDIAHNWVWAPFLQYLSSSNAETKWYACESLSMVFNLSETQRMVFHSGHITRKEHIKLLLKNLEEKKIPPSENSTTIADIPVLPSVLSIDGIELCIENNSFCKEGCLVTVDSTKEHLRSLALAIAKDSPILIQGIVGSGKTSLVDHLAMITGRYNTSKYTKIQLGDQTDSKVLVGTYRCTDIPGEFVWQPGVLAQAVAEGNWILLEDVDYASMDVISVLLPVLESRTLLLPGRGENIRAAPGFQIFVTQRLIAGTTGLYKQHLGHFHIIERYLRKIHVEPLSREELKIVLNTKYPVLRTVCDRLLEVYFFLVSGYRDNMELNIKSRETRLVSTRDLLKWCKRMTEHFDVTSSTSQHNAFLDALDIFCGYLINNETRLPAAEMIGSRLNILKAKAEFYVNSHKPAVDINDKNINIGRVSLPLVPSNLLHKESRNYTFSYTRQAAILLERVAISIKNNEPVLLVGETGCGKTTTVQYLANVTNHKLTVVNMNQQSDSADLLGGYKPVEIRHVVAPVRDAFEELFGQSFSLQENSKFLGHVMKTFCNHRWQDLFTLMLHSQKAAVKKFRDKSDILKKWEELGIRIMQLKAQVKSLESTLAFAFVEGSLVKAVKNGDWILLDEINLASAETLECLSGLLEGEGSSLFLFEKGDREPLKIHPEFRLFACMNPATDVGKKDLPPGIRNRFTEFFVEEVTSETDLKILVGDYLRGLSVTSTQIDGIVKFYQKIRSEAVRVLEDGTGHKPHYSLRTLCRALTIAATNMFGSVPRSIYEAFCLSFLTQLDRKSHPVVEGMIATQIMQKKNLKAITSQAIPKPSSGFYTEVENYWIEQGDRELLSPEDYVITPTVRANLRDIARIVSASRHPVLLQGETSVGKTSLIFYLAKLTGNTCVRVNNHEHTDIQEYLGSYTAGENGKLVFQEGVLVQAMRKGHWIILDELNLAPSDVLEALNRVLDENRELFITETQETVKAHPRFQIFATQNPPGQYGGRKVLSRAFRNRFVELHFDEIPTNELETILNQRCQIPLSYAKKLVAVHKELQIHRRGSAAFAGKSGFVTLRDLFRWAERYRLADISPAKLYDWDQHMADEGYLVLSGKVRKPEERLIIQKALEKHMKRKVEEERLFWLSDDTSPVTKEILRETMNSPKGFEHIVWTFEMRRLAVLVGKSFKFKEPVLLVGDTGCGKTTICQLFAAQSSKHLYSVNCHQHSEAADFLGGLRPARSRNE